MRNTIYHIWNLIWIRTVRGSLIVVLSLILLAAVNSSAFAYDLYRPGPQVYRVGPLQNAASGSADVRWNQQQKTLTVALTLDGLPPNSTHAAHIHAGTCSAMGKAVYTLREASTDARGHATSTTTIHNVTNGIPATGWLIGVHNGPTARTNTILCGNITNSKKAASTTVQLQGVTKH